VAAIRARPVAKHPGHAATQSDRQPVNSGVLEGRGVSSRLASPFVLDAVMEYLRTKAALEPKTVASYSGVLLGSDRGTKKPLGQPLAVYFHNRKVASLTPDELATWFAQRVRDGAQVTKYRISGQTREFLGWALKRGYTKADLASAIQTFTPGESRKEHLTWSQVHGLLRMIPEDRYRFAGAWLFWTGCRVSEAIRARQEDVLWDDDNEMFGWSIPQTKTHKARIVWLPDHVATLLQQARERNAPKPSWPVLWDASGRGFARIEDPAAQITEKTINGFLERARDASGLMIKVTAHVAKHSYCTNWIKERGHGELAMEKLSRQVGTSVAVLRNTYVHHTLDAADFADIRSFGSRPANYGS
jgi:integrase